MFLQDPSTSLSQALWSIDSRLTYVCPWHLFQDTELLEGRAPLLRPCPPHGLAPICSGWVYTKCHAWDVLAIELMSFSLKAFLLMDLLFGGTFKWCSHTHKKSIREFNFLSKPSSIKCVWTQISRNLAPSRCLRYFLRNKSVFLRSWLFVYTVGQGTMGWEMDKLRETWIPQGPREGKDKSKMKPQKVVVPSSLLNF